MGQPLKRFTQCGSLTMLFIVFIVLFGVSSTALTTFGKATPNNQQQTAPTKGKECSSHAECSTLQATSCVRDLNDARLRCLCGDYVAPVNGICSTKYKGLRHMCENTDKCDEGMICAVENATRTTGFGRQNQSGVKVCLCDEDNGYDENVRDQYCSGSVSLMTTSIFLPLLSIIVSFMLTENH